MYMWFLTGFMACLLLIVIIALATGNYGEDKYNEMIAKDLNKQFKDSIKVFERERVVRLESKVFELEKRLDNNWVKK